MENKGLILIFIGIIAILLVVLFSMIILNITNDPCELTITSPNTLQDGSKLTLTLKDKNQNPLTNQEIDITITDANGQENQQKITTNENGNGELQLNGLTEGQYTIQAKYKNTQTNQTITISNQVTATSITSETSSSSNDKTESVISEDGYSYKTGYGPDYDSQGVSREEAAAKGWHYIPGTDDWGNDMGAYTPYDPINKCYHT